MEILSLLPLFIFLAVLTTKLQSTIVK